MNHPVLVGKARPVFVKREFGQIRTVRDRTLIPWWQNAIAEINSGAPSSNVALTAQVQLSSTSFRELRVSVATIQLNLRSRCLAI
ncbi:hypothetical protein ABIB68_007098 [Bradyrhizobium sp. F1.2.2]